MSTVPYPNAEQIFQMQYESVRRDEVVGVLLAIFLGCFGIHHFYLGRNGLGILYLCFFWTGIPALLGLIECFFMPGRVRAYNAMHAAGLAASLGIPLPAYLAYPGWVAPGFGNGFAPQGGYSAQGYAAPGYTPVYGSSIYGSPVQGSWVQGSGQASSTDEAASGETTLVACGNCRMTNPPTARFCSGCGGSLVSVARSS
jgi:TM2 domain-containing membrane protein YozV